MVKNLPNTDFFSKLAEDYDLMIPFEQAVERKKKILESIVTHDMKYAADIGCGTGTDSIALGSLGLMVDAFDPSGGMIKSASENATRAGFKLNFYNYPLDSIPITFSNKYDFVISLGNSFANIDRRIFHKSIDRLFKIIRKGGTILIQILNYLNVIEQNRRIVNITKGKRKYFVRFYDFVSDEIIFNILTFEKENPSEHQLISTKLFAYNKNDFNIELKKAGFTSIDFYSDFKLSTFNSKQSKDLIIRAVK